MLVPQTRAEPWRDFLGLKVPYKALKMQLPVLLKNWKLHYLDLTAILTHADLAGLQTGQQQCSGWAWRVGGKLCGSQDDHDQNASRGAHVDLIIVAEVCIS